MAKRMTLESLDVIRNNIRFPLHVIKTRLKEENPVLFEELKNEFESMDGALNEAVNSWEIWNE